MKDYFGYEGKICVVTGAAMGMGKATAEALIDLGAEVYALDLAEVTLPVKKYIHVDLGNKQSIDEAFEQLPEKIDRYFGIAGICGTKFGFETTVRINFLSNKYITETYLTKRVVDGGAIAYIASKGGNNWDVWRAEFEDLVDAPTYEEALEIIADKASRAIDVMGYDFSKRCLTLFAMKQVQAFTERLIRVNVVMPGVTDTHFISEFEKDNPRELLLQSCKTAKRFATSEEMALPMVFFNSDMATYISGVTMNADFGQTMVDKLSGYKGYSQIKPKE